MGSRHRIKPETIEAIRDYVLAHPNVHPCEVIAALKLDLVNSYVNQVMTNRIHYDPDYHPKLDWTKHSARIRSGLCSRVVVSYKAEHRPASIDCTFTCSICGMGFMTLAERDRCYDECRQADRAAEQRARAEAL